MSNYQDILDLQAPHGFLIAQGKQTAIARIEPLDTDKAYLIVSNGEAYGISTLDQPAQIKTKEFDNDEYFELHRVMQRERRQWWPDNDTFYVYKIKEFEPFETLKLYEDNQLIDEPRLTPDQWQIVSKAKELPRTIIISEDFINLTTDHNILCGDKSFYHREVKPVLDATFNQSVDWLDAKEYNGEIIPVYSLALVRNPRMRLKKSPEVTKQAEIEIERPEDEDMPYRIVERDGEFCVMKIGENDMETVEKCHPDREMAQAHLAALRINVETEEGKSGMNKSKKPKLRKKEIFGNEQSIEQQLSFIRRQFEDEFNSKTNNVALADAESYIWVSDIFDSFVIVDEEGKLFRVDYMIFENEIIFSPRERWVEVERGYTPKGFKMLASNLKKNNYEPNFLQRLRLATKHILDIVTLAETKEKKDKQDILTSNYGIAQKEVNGELWHFTWSTNAFEDRDKEIFSTQALENYVLQAETKQDRGYFNLWHINAEDGNFNTDFARKEWQGVIGRFLVEAGPYLDDEKGEAAKQFFAKYSDGHPELAPEGWGCSPEFRYLPEERETGIYENIWITRTSTLPKMAAANIWTDTRQLMRSKDMLTDEQTKAAVSLFGQDYVDKMMIEGEKRTEDLETAGVAHKEIKEETEQAQEPETTQINIDMEALAAEVGKQFGANLEPITEALSAMATELKELKDWREKEEKEKEVKGLTESPRFVFNMQRASEAKSTMVTEDDKLIKSKPTETKADKEGDAWSQIFNK